MTTERDPESFEAITPIFSGLATRDLATDDPLQVATDAFATSLVGQQVGLTCGSLGESVDLADGEVPYLLCAMAAHWLQARVVVGDNYETDYWLGLTNGTGAPPAILAYVRTTLEKKALSRFPPDQAAVHTKPFVGLIQKLGGPQRLCVVRARCRVNEGQAYQFLIVHPGDRKRVV